LLEVLGMGVSLIGLVAACMGAGSMKYELMCLGVGVVIFYCGNTLRVGAEGR
jgi:hypothetical protein